LELSWAHLKDSWINVKPRNIPTSPSLNLGVTTGVPRERLGGFKPFPLNLQIFFELCVCKIYCLSCASILIKSFVSYRKTLKLVH